jgi:hypothetical protein
MGGVVLKDWVKWNGIELKFVDEDMGWSTAFSSLI